MTTELKVGLLHVGDLTIASLDQVPMFQKMQGEDVESMLSDIVNFLRAGVPCVQLCFHTNNTEDVATGRNTLIDMLDHIVQPGPTSGSLEKFDVSLIVMDEDIALATYTISRELV